MKYKQSGPYRPEGQPAGPGHHELRPGDQRGGQLRHDGQALGAGINFFDTADVYGGPQSRMKQGYGITEEIIGRWLAQGGGRREQIVLATKVYNTMGEGPNERGLSAYHIRRACEDSLRRLQTDHIDLYQMHHIERSTPWEEIWQAMEQLVREGKVIYVGSSNFAGWQIATPGVAAGRHFMGLVSEQSLYNLNARTIELEVIPACRPSAGADPVEPAGRRVAGRRAPEGQPGRRPTSARSRNREAPRHSWRPTRSLPRAGRAARRCRRWPGCCATRLSPRRSSGRARSSS